jgi:8-amino-7-oxononanoate synthase
MRTIKDIEKKQGKYVWFRGKKLLNLSSNNYLGFADNQAIMERFSEKHSFGSASARLLTGTLPVYKELEELLTELFNTEATLLFNSGYHANVGIMSTLQTDVIFADKLCHASIIDGMRLSKAKFFRFPHNDTAALERRLSPGSVIVTESVFSMDGDIAPLTKLVELKKKYNCLLVVDEAHGFGVFGQRGLGVVEELGLVKEIDLIMGTFGKAIGSYGAFVTGRKDLITHLINHSRPFIFSTALPPMNIAFSKYIIENELPHTLAARRRMLELGKGSHIIPILAGDKTNELYEKYFEQGFLTLPIHPPTVQTSRLRLSLTTQITKEDLCGIIG